MFLSKSTWKSRYQINIFLALSPFFFSSYILQSFHELMMQNSAISYYVKDFPQE